MNTKIRVRSCKPDRFDDRCEACARLQRFSPGKQCFDCVEALTWIKKQVKAGLNDASAEPDEYELAPQKLRYTCQVATCGVELPIGRRLHCDDCSNRMAKSYEGLDPSLVHRLGLRGTSKFG